MAAICCFDEKEQHRHIQREAGASLLKQLLSLKVLERISAKDLCICCHYLHVGGMPGSDWASYAVAPEVKSSGRFMKKLDTVLPKPKYVYGVECPVMEYHEETSSSRDVLCSAA